MSKKTAKKKSRKSNSAPRNLPWHKALETPILQGAIRPLIETIASKGFKGLPDLHNNFQTAFKCSVSRDIFTHWLKRLGLYDTVAGTQLRTLNNGLPPGPPTPTQLSQSFRSRAPQQLYEPDIQISRHPDEPGQLGLNGEPIAKNPDGFSSPSTEEPSVNVGESDEIDLPPSGPSKGQAFDERVLALAPSGEGPQPTILGGGVYGAPAGTIPIQG